MWVSVPTHVQIAHAQENFLRFYCLIKADNDSKQLDTALRELSYRLWSSQNRDNYN